MSRRWTKIHRSVILPCPRGAGDYNLVLLDQFLESKLQWVGTCNELNAGYAADGYARARGVAACVATFTVGGLSIINAIAGSYSEDLPIICITGRSQDCASPVCC